VVDGCRIVAIVVTTGFSFREGVTPDVFFQAGGGIFPNELASTDKCDCANKL